MSYTKIANRVFGDESPLVVVEVPLPDTLSGEKFKDYNYLSIRSRNENDPICFVNTDGAVAYHIGFGFKDEAEETRLVAALRCLFLGISKVHIGTPDGKRTYKVINTDDKVRLAAVMN